MMKMKPCCALSFRVEPFQMSKCSEIKTQPTSGRRHANKDGAPTFETEQQQEAIATTRSNERPCPSVRIVGRLCRRVLASARAVAKPPLAHLLLHPRPPPTRHLPQATCRPLPEWPSRELPCPTRTLLSHLSSSFPYSSSSCRAH